MEFALFLVSLFSTILILALSVMFIIIVSEILISILNLIFPRPRYFAITLIWTQKSVNVLTICRLGYKLEDMQKNWLQWLENQYPKENGYSQHEVRVIEVK